jgi:uroporphyrinogen decarboxylase
MNQRENFLNILDFKIPERVIYEIPVYELNYYGMNHEGFDNAAGDDSPVGSTWMDIWGTGWRKIHPGVMGMVDFCPLAEPAALRTYTWPDPDDPRLVKQIDRLKQNYPGGDLLLAGGHRDTLWEKAYMLVGMQDLMMYFISDPGFAHEVLHHIMDFQLAMARHYISQGVEMANLGDNLGTQQGPLLGPRIVNRFLRPEYQRLFDLYKQHGVRIAFHSCGRVDSVLDMFLDLGVDILNPVQATANDLDALRAKTQGKMALQGGVSSATLMEGPVERIQQEVRTRLWQLGRAGGYVCQPDQGMPYPSEHLRAFEEAVERYGTYPIHHFQD